MFNNISYKESVSKYISKYVSTFLLIKKKKKMLKKY